MAKRQGLTDAAGRSSRSSWTLARLWRNSVSLSVGAHADACERALAINSASYKSVSEILKQGLDRLPLPKPRTSSPAITHGNVRGSDYYQPQTRAGDEPADPTQKEPRLC